MRLRIMIAKRGLDEWHVQYTGGSLAHAKNVVKAHFRSDPDAKEFDRRRCVLIAGRENFGWVPVVVHTPCAYVDDMTKRLRWLPGRNRSIAIDTAPRDCMTIWPNVRG